MPAARARGLRAAVTAWTAVWRSLPTAGTIAGAPEAGAAPLPDVVPGAYRGACEHRADRPMQPCSGHWCGFTRALIPGAPLLVDDFNSDALEAKVRGMPNASRFPGWSEGTRWSADCPVADRE